MNVEMALDQLGATQVLSSQDLRDLDRNGYLIFPSLLDSDELTAIRSRVHELQQGDHNFIDDSDCIRIHHLHMYGEMFDRLWLDPRLLSATAHLMGGDFKLYQLAMRASRPGAPFQQIHTDSEPRADRGPYATSTNSVWMLDDFTSTNGATRVIPGSHRWDPPPTAPDDAPAPHPGEIQIEAPAGSLMVFSGHLWHGGGENRTNATRRGIFCSFHERDTVPPDSHLALYEKHRPQIRAVPTHPRLSEAANYIMGQR